MGGSKEGDTDLPLINTDGDQGERQDDEDGSFHINHPSTRMVCNASVCAFLGVLALTSLFKKNNLVFHRLNERLHRCATFIIYPLWAQLCACLFKHLIEKPQNTHTHTHTLTDSFFFLNTHFFGHV